MEERQTVSTSPIAAAREEITTSQPQNIAPQQSAAPVPQQIVEVPAAQPTRPVRPPTRSERVNDNFSNGGGSRSGGGTSGGSHSSGVSSGSHSGGGGSTGASNAEKVANSDKGGRGEASSTEDVGQGGGESGGSSKKNKQEAGPEASQLIQIANELRRALFDFIDKSNGINDISNGANGNFLSLEGIENIKSDLGGQISDERDAVQALARLEQVAPDLANVYVNKKNIAGIPPQTSAAIQNSARELQQAVLSNSSEARKIQSGDTDILFNAMQSLVYLADNVLAITGKKQ